MNLQKSRLVVLCAFIVLAECQNDYKGDSLPNLEEDLSVPNKLLLQLEDLKKFAEKLPEKFDADLSTKSPDGLLATTPEDLYTNPDELVKTEMKIVGGIEAKPHSAPYIASLLIKDRNRMNPYCGASIISDSWLVTAAHCLSVEPYRVQIAAGHHNINQLSEPVQMRRADMFLKHKGFKGIGPDDIGLVHVTRPFVFTTNVRPIKLSTNKQPYGIATLYGWGSIANTTTRKFPEKLQMANLTIVTNDYCRYLYPVNIPNSNLCAGLSKAGKGGCVGDSGGPLVQNGTLLGIVSYGPGTCDPTEGPTVFAKVANYKKWIEDRLAITFKKGGGGGGGGGGGHGHGGHGGGGHGGGGHIVYYYSDSGSYYDYDYGGGKGKGDKGKGDKGKGDKGKGDKGKGDKGKGDKGKGDKGKGGGDYDYHHHHHQRPEPCYKGGHDYGYVEIVKGGHDYGHGKGHGGGIGGIIGIGLGDYSDYW